MWACSRGKRHCSQLSYLKVSEVSQIEKVDGNRRGQRTQTHTLYTFHSSCSHPSSLTFVEPLCGGVVHHTCDTGRKIEKTGVR